MVLSNVNTQPAISRLMAGGSANPQAQNAKDLVKAVRSGDVDAARDAYAAIVKNAPADATWPKGSAFADLGKALAQGDLDAAKSIIVDAVKAARGQGPQPLPAPAPAPAGGSVGTQLNVAA